MKRLILLACILVVPAALAYGQFRFIDIDCTAGGDTTARSINNLGEIVGRTGPDQNGNDHAVMIKNGKCIPLAPNTILGTNWSEAWKNNDQGDIVGYFEDDQGYPHGFLLSKKGVLTRLDFPGAGDTEAWGINNFGTVVGFFDDYDQYGNWIATHGFAWKNGSFFQLDYPGSGDTDVGGINDFGAMVGYWDSGPTATVGHGFIRSITGKFIDYDVPITGVINSQPNDINDLGLFVGLYADSSDVLHGFQQAGPSFATIDYPDAYQTTAWGINTFGLIVGTHYNSASDADNGIPHGYVAYAKGKGNIEQYVPTLPALENDVSTRDSLAAPRPNTNAKRSFSVK
jgi:probable HAF family extracellular repeat protein